MSHIGDPFDDIPLLPPRAELESIEVMRACVSASRSLAELQGLVGMLPEKRILLELLPMQESESSSAIENIVSSKKRLFLASSGNKDMLDKSTREIVGYNRAISVASGKIPDMSTVKEICSTILGDTMEFRSEKDETIGLFSYGSKVPVYTPPSGKVVGRLMRNLQEYIFTDDEVDPLIKMAVIHYQFEATHPFFDGNGRTGRILNIVYLQYSKLLKDPALFLSGFIISNKSRYNDLLNSVTTRDDWEPWILFMLEGVEKTSKQTISTIRSIVGMMKDCKKLCQEAGIPEKCAEAVFGNPFCTVSMMQEAIGCSRPSSVKYLRALEGKGILAASKGRGALVFENICLLKLFSNDAV